MTDELTPRTVVLVVEDEPDHLLMLQFALESFGCDVVAAPSFAAGRAALAAQHFDVLIADFFLGDGTAVALLDGLGDRRPRLAIVMSGLDGDEDIDRSLAAGYDAHLVKPTSLDTLREVISAGLGRQGSGIRFAKDAQRAEPAPATTEVLAFGTAVRLER